MLTKISFEWKVCERARPCGFLISCPQCTRIEGCNCLWWRNKNIPRVSFFILKLHVRIIKFVVILITYTFPTVDGCNLGRIVGRSGTISLGKAASFRFRICRHRTWTSAIHLWLLRIEILMWMWNNYDIDNPTTKT
jgi:hypothetical protein